MMWFKIKLWAAIITGAVIAILTGYSRLQKRRREAQAREWVGIAKAREAKVAADEAKTMQARAEYVAAKRDYQVYAAKAGAELETINAKLETRKNGRLGTLLARYDELRRGRT